MQANLGTHVDGRKIDDHGHAFIQCRSGAKIILTASQIMQGHANDLDVEWHGSKGSLYWKQEDPGFLELRINGEPLARYQRNACKMTPIAASLCRVPGGHEEAYLEGFANVYVQAMAQMRRAKAGETQPTDPLALAPSISTGVLGNLFIDRALKSSSQDGNWVKFDHFICG